MTTNKKEKNIKKLKNNNNIANINNIADTAIDSCDDGLQSIIDFYNSNVGMLTPYGLQLLQSYAEEMPADLIIYAMRISVEADKRTISYIKAILNSWQKKGIKTLIEAQKENKDFNKNKQKQETKSTQRNYADEDLDKLYANE